MAPAWRAESPAGVATSGGLTVSGLSTCRMSLVEQAAAVRRAATEARRASRRALMRSVVRVMVVDLRLEAEAHPHQERPDLGLGEEVLHAESVERRLPRPVDLRVHPGVAGPGVEVPAGGGDGHPVRPDHAGYPGGYHVGGRDLAKLHERPVLDVAPVGFGAAH